MLGRKNNLQRLAANTPASVFRDTPVQLKRTLVNFEEAQPARFMVQMAKPKGTKFLRNTSLPRRLNSTVPENRVEVEQMERQVLARRQRYTYPVGNNNVGCTSTRIPIPVSTQRQRILPSNRSDSRIANEELERSDLYESYIEDIAPPHSFNDLSGISIPSRPESRARLCSRIGALLSDMDTPDQRNEEGGASGNRIDFINDPLNNIGGTYDRFPELPRFKSSTIPSVVDFQNIECPPGKIMPLQSRTSKSKSIERSYTIPTESTKGNIDELRIMKSTPRGNNPVRSNTPMGKSSVRPSPVSSVGPQSPVLKEQTVVDGAPKKHIPLRKHTPSTEMFENDLGEKESPPKMNYRSKYELSTQERFKKYLEKIQGVTTKKPNLAVRKLPFSTKQDDEDDFTDIKPISYDNDRELTGSTPPTEIPQGDDEFTENTYDEPNAATPVESNETPPPERMDRQTGNNLEDKLDDIEIPTVPSIEDLGREVPPKKFTPSKTGFTPLEHSRHTIREVRGNLKEIIENLSMVFDQLDELNFYNRAVEVEINYLRGKLEKVLPSYDDDTLFP